MSSLAVYLGPSMVAWVLALYPAPWHLKTGNIATLTMIFWMTALNTVHIVNCSVWRDNNDIVAEPWGDISVAVNVGYNYGLPIAHLLLAKQLDSYTSLRPNSPAYDAQSRRRHRIFDLVLAIGGPIFIILLHLSMMDRRFYIVEKLGPMAATYWNAWGVLMMGIIPILIAGGCGVYTVMALSNVYMRKRQMRSMVASEGTIYREQFWRLMALAILELGTCGIRAGFNLMSFEAGPQPLGHLGPPEHDLSRIEQLSWSQLSTGNKRVLNLQWFTVIACSVVFFLCFATSTETKRFYSKILGRFFPAWERRRRRRSVRLGSSSTGLTSELSSMGQKTAPPEDDKYPLTPHTSSSQGVFSPSDAAPFPKKDALWQEPYRYGQDSIISPQDPFGKISLIEALSPIGRSVGGQISLFRDPSTGSLNAHSIQAQASSSDDESEETAFDPKLDSVVNVHAV